MGICIPTRRWAPRKETMGRPLRVLVIEDSVADAELVLAELRRGGYDPAWRRVDTPEAMQAALEEQHWDIALADYSMPRFSAPAALDLMKQMRLDVPFIILSGTIGEDTAVDSLRAGAADFMLKDNLTRLVPAVEREVREAAIRAERRAAHELREAFITVASHELRTPLTLLLCHAALLREEKCVPERLSLGIAQASERMRRVIDQLTTMLAINKFSSPLDLRTVEVAQLLQEAADDSRAFSEARRQSLVVEIADDVSSIRADSAKVRDVIDNLLLNAIKFTPDGGRVELSARRAVDGGTEIRVSDSGDGIDEASLPFLFEPFFAGFDVQHHSSGHFSYGARGLGLGLAVAKAFVEMHGGSIEAQNEGGTGVGSTFIVTLPKEPAAGALEQGRDSAPSDARRRGPSLPPVG